MHRLRLFHLSAVLALSLAATLAQTQPDYRRTEDVVYGRKFGTALTLDVFQPARTNGYGLLFMVSGGFFSSHDAINPGILQPFLDRGYTVFAVVHGSQPKFAIPEIVQDIHRAVRFVRFRSAQCGIHPDRLGITGASAGGHLSLTLGTQGAPGKSDAKDPIDRESSAVQAVACFFPPTDFLNYGAAGVDAVGVGILAAFKPAFGAQAETPEGRRSLGREISPINFVSSHLPPILIIHGDADTLVPIQQAESFVKKAQEAGAKNVKLIVRAGQQHGWPEIGTDLNLFADWFDEHLRGLRK